MLLAGDAIYLERNLGERRLPYRIEDDHLYLRSLREIELFKRESPDALIVPGHDMPHWKTLAASTSSAAAATAAAAARAGARRSRP